MILILVASCLIRFVTTTWTVVLFHRTRDRSLLRLVCVLGAMLLGSAGLIASTMAARGDAADANVVLTIADMAVSLATLAYVRSLAGTFANFSQGPADKLLQHFAELDFLYHAAPIGLCLIDADFRYVRINDRLAQINGLSAEEHLGKSLRDVVPDIASVVEPIYSRVFRTGKPEFGLDNSRRDSTGAYLLSYRASYHPLVNENRETIGVITVIEDVTERKNAERLLAAENSLLESVASGVPLDETLVRLVQLIEEQSADIIVSVMMLDEKAGCLHNIVAPGLSAEYNSAIEGLEIGEGVGACGTAAWRNEPVFAADIETDPFWQPYRELARSDGLRACWSTPINDSAGNVLGTFAIYRRVQGLPTARHQKLIDAATHIASLLLTLHRQELSLRESEKDRVATEEALRKSESLFRNVTEHSPGAILIHTEGRIVYANPTAIRMVGADGMDAILDRRIEHLFDGEERSTVADRTSRIDTGGQPQEPIELQLRRDDGAMIDIEASANPIEFDGKPAVLGMAIDITERKRAVNALRENEERLRLVFDQQFQFSSILSPDGRVLAVNELLLRVQGGNQDEYVGTYFWKCPAWESLPEWHEIIESHVREALIRDEPLFVEDTYRAADGSLRFADASYSAIRDPEGEVRFILVQASDVTERKRAEAELRDREQRFRAIFNSTFQFIGLIDTDGTLLEANETALNFGGLAYANVLGKPFWEAAWWANSDTERLRDAISHAADGEFVRYDVDVTGADSIETIDFSIKPVFDEHGEVRLLVPEGRIVTEEKRAEASLLKNRELLELTNRLANVGGWELNLETMQLLWTEQTCRIHEVPENYQPDLETAIEFYAPEARSVIEAAVQRAIDDGTPWDIELRFITAKGNLRWVHANGIAETIGGKRVRLHGAFQDITERKEAELEVNYRLDFEAILARISSTFINLPATAIVGEIDACLELLGNFLDVDRAIMTELSEDRNTLYVNHEWIAPGITSAIDDHGTIDVSGLPWLQQRWARGSVLVLSTLNELPEDASQEREMLTQMGVKSTIAVPLMIDGHASGEVVFDSIARQRDWPGGLVNQLKLVGEIFSNALIRKRNDEALERRERQYRTLYEQTPAMLHSIDANGRIINVSDYWLESMGYQRDEVIGRLATDFLTPDSKRFAEDECAPKFQASGFLKDEELQFIKKDGVVMETLLSAIREDDTAGNLTESLVVVIDVTERKRAQEENRKHREVLAHMTRLSTMGELVAGIAHEVKQPLYAITNYASAGSVTIAGVDPSRPPEPGWIDNLREWNDGIKNASKRASEIINRLREFARKGVSQRERIVVRDVVRDSVELVAFEARQCQVHVEIDLADEVPDIYADRIQTEQVIVNLLQNAYESLQVTTDPRRVLVRTEVSDGFVEIQVVDNGPGIPNEERGKLFEAFFTTKASGMGMGLAISQTIVEDHGGRIWGSTNELGGATFHFTLPFNARTRIAG